MTRIPGLFSFSGPTLVEWYDYPLRIFSQMMRVVLNMFTRMCQKPAYKCKPSSLSLISPIETVKFQVLISRIRAEYGDLHNRSFYSVQMWEKRTRKNNECGLFSCSRQIGLFNKTYNS